jgi:hypothetical protein
LTNAIASASFVRAAGMPETILLSPERDGRLGNVVTQEREGAGYMPDVADVHDRPGVAPEDVQRPL